MANHELKCDTGEFGAIALNEQRAIITKDTGFAIGDTLTLRETTFDWQPGRKGELTLTGAECQRRIEHIYKNHNNRMSSGFVSLSLAPIDEPKSGSITDAAVRAFNENPPTVRSVPCCCQPGASCETINEVLACDKATPHYPRPMAPITPPPSPGYAKPVCFIDYQAWLKMGKSLYVRHGGSDIGRRMWIEWTKKSNKFHESTIDRFWDSFKPPKGDAK